MTGPERAAAADRERLLSDRQSSRHDWRAERIAPHQLVCTLTALETDGWTFVQVVAEAPWVWVLAQKIR